VPGLAPASIGQGVALGAAFGAADAGISQPYEGETTGDRALNIAKGAGIGAGFGLAPMTVPLFKAIQGKLKGLLSEPASEVTLKQARELGNIILRGKRSGQLSNRETDQLIESQKAVFDKIARNMDEESLNSIRNESERTLFNDLGGIKIPDDAEKGMVGRNDYVSRSRMSGMPTSEENIIKDEISGVKKSLESAKKEGNQGVIAEDSERLTQLKRDAAKAKQGRNTAYAEGEEQLVQAPEDKSQHAWTDKTTEKFFSNLNQTMDDAVTKMGGTWKTEGGRFRRNSRGQIIPGTPEQLGNRANYYINYLSDKIQSRARGINTGVGEFAPKITNEDIAVVLSEMGHNNEWEFMDAVLDACTWLSKTDKDAMKYNAILNKASVNALDALNVTPRASIAGKLPKVGKGNEANKGWPADFSRRYEAMNRGTPYSVDFLDEETMTLPYSIPGIVVTNGSIKGGKE
jgi:Tfp pilus assembly protein PilX